VATALSKLGLRVTYYLLGSHTERVGNYFKTAAFQNISVAKGALSRWQVTAVRVWIICGDIMPGEAVVLGAVSTKCQVSHQNIQVHWSVIEISLLINLLTPNVNYSSRTAPLTSKVAFYIFIQQI